MKPIEFHGACVEDYGSHRHFKAHPSDLEGKTIIRFECSADNMWKLFFSDGTAVSIEADVVGMYKIPYMTLCNTCWEDEQENGQQ